MVDVASTRQEQPKTTQGLVLRNTMLLVIGQALGMPLSIVVNAVMARRLGPEDFGYIYLATTFAGFGFLIGAWGQSGTLPALVARDRSQAGVLLGTGLAWRAASSLGVYMVMAGGCFVLGYNLEFQVALGLVVIGSAIGALIAALLDLVRGFERTDITAYSLLGWQFLTALLTIPTLFLGGRLRAVLLAQALAAAVTLVYAWRSVRATNVGKLSVRRDTLSRLLSEGTPFLFLNLTMAAQPFIDGLFLSKLAPAESVGWYAAARKLIGVLVYPASAMTTALYPTLSRLYVENQQSYRETAGSALRATAVLVMPVTLGCALYADIGIRIFSKESFGPAETDLQVLSLFVLACYFTMILGCTLSAAGRQRAWAGAQFLCVVVSAVFDPILVPWFQKHMNNGGLGVCISSVASELLMVASAIWICPKGIFGRALVRQLLLTIVAGGAMAATARLLAWLNPFVAAPIAVSAYVACLWATGGLNKEHVAMLSQIVKRKGR
jgi:O-antigen/teichoic acid export membrane protein